MASDDPKNRDESYQEPEDRPTYDPDMIQENDLHIDIEKKEERSDE